MRMRPRLVLEVRVLALLLATAGCTKPSIDNGTATGGSSGTSTGGQTGATGGSTGTGGSRTTGTGGSTTTGTGGSTVTGTGGSTATGTGGSTTGATGGATGTGGSTTSGTGGAGGAIVQKDCATKTKMTNPVFLNFENYDGTVTAANYATAFGGTTANTGPPTPGVYSFGDGSTTPTLSIMAGHPPSNWAASQSVTQASCLGNGRRRLDGVRGRLGVQGDFLLGARLVGDRNFLVQHLMESTPLPDATNAAGGGTCPGTTDTCKGPSKANIPLTAIGPRCRSCGAISPPGFGHRLGCSRRQQHHGSRLECPPGVPSRSLRARGRGGSLHRDPRRPADQRRRHLVHSVAAGIRSLFENPLLSHAPSRGPTRRSEDCS